MQDQVQLRAVADFVVLQTNLPGFRPAFLRTLVCDPGRLKKQEGGEKIDSTPAHLLGYSIVHYRRRLYCYCCVGIKCIVIVITFIVIGIKLNRVNKN